jgi:hypothetical protein
LLADVNDDGNIDYILALDTTGRLYGWTVSGTALAWSPLQETGLMNITNVSLLATPAIGDIDGDGNLDVAWGGDDTAGNAYLTAYTLSTGTRLGSFPVTLSNNVGTGTAYPRTTSVALADVTGNGLKEIFIGYNDVSGTPRGYVARCTSGGVITPFSMNSGEQIGSGGTPTTQSVISDPAIGDVDNDSEMELVIGGDQGNVYIWNANTGGVPIIVSTGAAVITSAPALGYLTSNTGLDIVVANASGTVFCIRGGAILWQKNVGIGGLVSPVIGDVDGDNALEVVIARMRSGRVLVLESSDPANYGTPNISITESTRTTGQINASAAVTDLDRDADYEIFVTDDASSPTQDTLYIWDIPKTLPTASLQTILGWPFYQGNYHRDGAITTANLYPVNVTYDISAWPLVTLQVHVENRGTGVANNVALKYVSYQPFMSLVSPTNGIVLVTTGVPAGSIAAGVTGVTEPLTFDFTGYAGQEIILYFDITYTDANGSEYLIHR